jgi:uncharacterized protein (TIGR00251 family)
MVDVRPDPATPGAWLLPVKAVPGARRDAIVGPLGDRLKIRVAAPPEGGRANTAIRRLIASALGVRASAVTIAAGTTSPEKTLRIEGVGEQGIRALTAR